MNMALLLIDIQNDYFSGGKAVLHEPEKAVKNARAVLDYFRRNGFPVLHVQHINRREGAAFFLPDTVGSEIHHAVKPLASEVVVIKQYPNSFYQTGLSAYLAALAVDHLIVAGMMSHMCIDTTVRAAKDLGYRVTVLEDACATMNLAYRGKQLAAPLVHQAFMAALQPIFAEICTTEEFLNKQ